MPLTSKASVKYVYYGGVEGSYQHQDISDSSWLDPVYGAQAFSYSEAQLITARLAFSGTALGLINAGHPGAISLPQGTSGIDFFFPQTRVGDYDESNIISSLDIAFSGADAPIKALTFGFFDGADGPNMNAVSANHITMTDDDDAQAESFGVWLPENVKADFRTGLAGDDNLKGKADYNILSGANGSDIISTSKGQGWFWGGSGNDTLKGGDKNDFLFGGADNDIVQGNGGNDLIKGGSGHDQLLGHEGNDELWGGVGGDYLKGGSGNDTMLGGADGDTLYGNDGKDLLDGGSGDDFLEAGSGDDVLRGGTGNDRMDAGPGRDVFIFNDGDGIDTIHGFVSGADKIDMRGTSINSYAELVTTASEVDDELIFDNLAAFGFTLILHGTSPGEIHASDFLF